MTKTRTKVRKNDVVIITTGREKGKKGRVLKVFPSENKVIVEKVNFIKRHSRPSQKHRQGGIIEKEGFIDLSKVMIYCKKCDRGSKIGQIVLDDGKKQRFCRCCKETF